jgi:hypothetical protein
LTAAAAIIRVPVETLTTLSSNDLSSTTSHLRQPISPTEDVVNLWQADDTLSDPHRHQSLGNNGTSQYELQPAGTTLGSLDNSLSFEQQSYSNWASVALSGDQFLPDPVETLHQQPSYLESQAAHAQYPFEPFQDDVSSLVPHANDMFTPSTPLEARSSHIKDRIQPVYPDEPYDVFDIHQMQVFSDLFDEGSLDLIGSSTQWLQDTSQESTLGSFLSSLDRTDNIVTSSPTFDPIPADGVAKQTMPGQRHSETADPVVTHVKIDQIANNLANDGYSRANQAVESNRHIDSTTSGTDDLGRITPSSSDTSASSWIVLTPGTTSTATSQKQSPKSIFPSTSEGGNGISPGEKPLNPTSAAVPTSMASVSSSNVYTLGPCTREWVIPKRVSSLQRY